MSEEEKDLSSGSNVVWEGVIHSTPLRVEVPHAGRIVSEWKTPHGIRNNSSKSLQEFEKAVLFQIALTSGDKGKEALREVREAIITAESERPAPKRSPESTRRRKPKPRHHRRSRRPPRR
jgi:hypothetical protein